MHKCLTLVAGFDTLAALFILFGIGFRLADHAVNLAIIKTARCLNTDFLFLAGRLVLGAYFDDAVGIDIKGYFDLRHTTLRRCNTFQIKLAKMLVVRRHLTLALIDRNGHRRLVVISCRKHLTFLGWNCGVAVNKTGEDTPKGFDTKGKRRHVKQQNIFDITSQNASLNGRARGDNLVWIDPAMRLFPKKFLHGIDDLGHASHAADENDFINITSLDPGIFQRRPTWLDGALHQVFDKLLQLGTRQLDIQMFGPRCISSNKWQVHIRLNS